MRVGQTSAIQFASQTLTSAGGFLATLYFARVVGSNTLGVYFLLLSLHSWLSLLVNAGLSPAITKRMSEGGDRGGYFQVGLGFISVTIGVTTLLVVLFSSQVTDYVSHPNTIYFLIFLISSGAAITTVRTGLQGTQSVHISGILTSTQSILRIVFQVGAVSLGLGLSGLVFGWVFSSLIIAIVGFLYLANIIKEFPKSNIKSIRKKARRLYSFAKYSWLGSLKSKTNNSADVLILGFFVSSNLIGIYSIAWNIASFLTIMGSAIETTLFPEFSQLERNDNYTEISNLLEKSLQYTGIFTIPGLFGGLLLGDRILRLYGDDFVMGAEVLVLLILSVLIYGYQKQLTGVLQGINRPDVDFKVNGTFILSNIILNVVLIPLLGWRGAAIATVLASSISLIHAYYVVNKILNVTVPFEEIGKQVGSSLVMTTIVFTFEIVESNQTIIGNNALVVLILVFIGAIVYVTVLLLVSRDTRRTIFENLK